MDKELLRRVALYRVTVSFAKQMLDAGVLTEKEFAEIDTNTAEKYGLSLSVIYR